MGIFELTHKFKLSAKKEKLLSEAPTNPLGRKTAYPSFGRTRDHAWHLSWMPTTRQGECELLGIEDEHRSVVIF